MAAVLEESVRNKKRSRPIRGMAVLIGGMAALVLQSDYPFRLELQILS